MEKAIFKLVLTALALLTSVAVSGALVSPPTFGQSVESVNHNARRALRVGDRLTVTARGATRGSASFYIFGVVADVGMRETSSGVYQSQQISYMGTYTVRPGDAARGAAVFASLDARGTESIAASTRPVTIDTRPPVVTVRYPKAGAQLANTRPNIAINLLDLETGVNPASVRLLVNGRDVTARASISDTSVAYNPDTTFTPGPVRIQLIVVDRAGNPLRTEWTFQIRTPRDLIKSVTINPAGALTRDDVLTVVMTGAPGGKATFAIQGIRGVAPMTESQASGVYFGTFPVRPELSVIDAPLFVTLERNGRRSTVPAAALVTILPGPPPAPRITSRALSSANPLSGRLALGGITGPGFRVLGRINYEVNSEAVEGQGTLGEFVAVAGADGRWQASIGPIVPLERAKVTLTIIAIDPAGQRSPPTTIELTS